MRPNTIMMDDDGAFWSMDTILDEEMTLSFVSWMLVGCQGQCRWTNYVLAAVAQAGEQKGTMEALLSFRK